MATWSKCEHDDGKGKMVPIYINLDNVLTVQRYGKGTVTTLVMVGGEKVHVNTPPKDVIK
jgi:hypothetical protein